MVLVSDSLLLGTEAPMCHQDFESQEACCLPGACIWDIAERLSVFICPSDHYPFLLDHTGITNTACNDTEQIRGDYKALGRRIKGPGAQEVFSSILPVEGKGPSRDLCMEVNAWLR